MLQVLKMECAFESVLSEAESELPSNAIARSMAAVHRPNPDYENGRLARFLLAFKDTTRDQVHAMVGQQDIEPVSKPAQSLQLDN